MYEGRVLVQLIRTVCLDEIVVCVPSAGIEEERNSNVITFLNKFSKHDIEVLANLVKKYCRIKGIHRFSGAFIHLCREVGLFRVGVLRV